MEPLKTPVQKRKEKKSRKGGRPPEPDSYAAAAAFCGCSAPNIYLAVTHDPSRLSASLASRLRQWRESMKGKPSRPGSALRRVRALRLSQKPNAKKTTTCQQQHRHQSHHAVPASTTTPKTRISAAGSNRLPTTN